MYVLSVVFIIRDNNNKYNKQIINNSKAGLCLNLSPCVIKSYLVHLCVSCVKQRFL